MESVPHVEIDRNEQIMTDIDNSGAESFGFLMHLACIQDHMESSCKLR